jgi:hypothetical protein
MLLEWRSAALLFIITGLTLGAFVAAAMPARADSVNVLWYSGGVQSFDLNYKGDIGTLAAPGAGDSSSATWNITFWDTGPIPAGTFNVLVIASPIGGRNTSPDYTALFGAGLTATSFGSRIMATGQDADWHFTNSPGPTNFDGPRGFLRDAINWAGNGTGLGLVMLGDAFASTFATLGPTGSGTENVVIPAPVAGFPINTGLTSAGLSNWSTSSHDTWLSPDLTVWTGINIDGNVVDGVAYVTLVTGGGIGDIAGGTPLPGALPLFASGLGALGLLRWRRKRKLTARAA